MSLLPTFAARYPALNLPDGLQDLTRAELCELRWQLEDALAGRR